jgi:ATP-binding cassette subfamily G (WHITE) protein 2 (SNQ2)
MIDVVSGDLSKGRDWSKVWLESEECGQMMKDIESLKEEYKNKGLPEREDNGHQFASKKSVQFKLVTKRASVQVRLVSERRLRGGELMERVVVERYGVCD